MARRLDAHDHAEDELGRLGLGGLQQRESYDVDDPGGAVRALDVAADPVQRLRDATQHEPTTDCCCCCCWARISSSRNTAGGLSTMTSRGRSCVTGRLWRVSDSTQVSFEPPPRDELTTSCPSGSATRVRPPGRTVTRSPSLTANGRRLSLIHISEPTRLGMISY